MHLEDDGFERAAGRFEAPVTSLVGDYEEAVEDYEEPVEEAFRVAPTRGVYLLPNLLTTGALFCGFYALIASMKGDFYSGAVAIFVAMAFDGLDGRVARLTNTTSTFGAEYDSLSDMVSFGVAPAILMYNWALSDAGKLGWVSAFCTRRVWHYALRVSIFSERPRILVFSQDWPVQWQREWWLAVCGLDDRMN